MRTQDGLFLQGPYANYGGEINFAQAGINTLVFAANSYTGETIVNSGTLDLAYSGSVTYGGSSGIVQFPGVTSLGSQTIALGGTLTFDVGTVLVAPGVLSASSLSGSVGHLTLVGSSSDSTIAVPEPASFILGALGLCAIFAVRRVFSRPAAC